MALNLTDNWQMAKILTDNCHLYPPIQTLYFSLWFKLETRKINVSYSHLCKLNTCKIWLQML